MFGKKIYILMAVFLAISGSILTWILLYGDFPHNSPVRAKQVFNIGDKADFPLLSSKFFSKYNTVINVQTIGEVRSFY
ncbi:MAG: hypothetical protein H6Q68_305 [Firmicutes bacterium]|nr:hypothetical protein [Bacillota bacterium]